MRSSVDLSSAKDAKRWGATAATAATAAAAAGAPPPLTAIMREQQELKRKMDQQRVQLQDSVWQQVLASLCLVMLFLF